jgi:hypothetical protein
MAAGNQEVARKKLINPRVATHIVTPKSDKVIAVGCKLPHGMHLDIRRDGEPVQRVTLKGINSLTAGAIIRPAQIGGFAITENVPKDFFEHWLVLHKEHPAVKNKLIFAHVQLASVRDMAEERSELTHGFEPIDPKAPAKGIETRKDTD